MKTSFMNMCTPWALVLHEPFGSQESFTSSLPGVSWAIKNTPADWLVNIGGYASWTVGDYDRLWREHNFNKMGRGVEV